MLNMTPMSYGDFRVGVPVKGNYDLVLNSALKKYGNTEDHDIGTVFKSIKGDCDFREQYIAFPLEPYAALVFSFRDGAGRKSVSGKKAKEAPGE